MKTSDFYYDLPQELIAQDPLEDRSSSRLMHLSLKDGSIEHRHFTDVLDYMEEGDCLVINDTKVIPARLYGHKEETGALIEILLLKRRESASVVGYTFTSPRIPCVVVITPTFNKSSIC